MKLPFVKPHRLDFNEMSFFWGNVCYLNKTRPDLSGLSSNWANKAALVLERKVRQRPSESPETSQQHRTQCSGSGGVGGGGGQPCRCSIVSYIVPVMKLHRGAGMGVRLLHRDRCNLISLTKPQSGADHLAVPFRGVEIPVPAEVPAGTGRKVQWLLSGLLINVQPGSPYHQELPLGHLLSCLHMLVSWDKFSLCLCQ